MFSQTTLTTSLPVSWYLDNAHFEQERTLIFGKEWLFAAPSSELKNSGDYVTVNIMNYKVIIIRQTDSTLKAFLNVCRHRSSQLLTGKGSCKGDCITCPYHAWTYELDGSLRKAPQFHDIEDFHKEDYSLYSVAVKESDGLVFINMSGTLNNEVDDKRFHALHEILMNYPFHKYTYHSSKTFTVECNWKTWVENYQECYHCRTLHPLFHKNYDLDNYKVRNGLGFSHHTCPRKQTSEVLGSKEGEWVYVWPNLALALYEHYYDTVEILPISPTQTQLVVTFYGQCNYSSDQLSKIIDAVSFQTFSEDIESCKRVQEGLLALRNVKECKASFLHPERESGVVYFDSLVQNAMLGSKMI